MQIVSIGDNLYEMLNIVCWEKWKKNSAVIYWNFYPEYYVLTLKTRVLRVNP